MIRFAVFLLAVAVSACGGEPQNEPLDANLGAANQALNARGWDYVTDGLDTSWQFKNGTGPCATAAGNVVTTAACATNDTAQHWEIFVKADGKYEICRPGTLVNPVGKVALLLNPDGPPSFVASQYWAAQCIYPTNFTDKPRDYRIGTVVLSYVLKGSSTFTSVPGAFRRDGTLILDAWRWMTKNSAGVVVPGKRTGNLDQQWTIQSISNM